MLLFSCLFLCKEDDMKNKKREAKKEKLDFKKVSLILLVVLAIILIFTFIDYLIHSLSEEYAVPDYYYRNKIIFGTGIGFIAYLFIGKKKPLTKALMFSGVIAVLLQIRYFLEGFPLKFVVEFLFFHFIALLLVSWAGFWWMRKRV